MEIKLLHTFLTLSKVKNYTQTAKLLNYTQSNITAQIKQLEKELHVKLFEQIGKKIYLTSYGEQLVPYAVRMMELTGEISSLFPAVHDSNHITIGVTESLSLYFLQPVIKDFLQQYPDIQLFIKLQDSSEFVSVLSDNSIDIALSLDTILHDSYITTLCCRHEPLALFAAADSPFSKLSAISASLLEPLPLIVTKKDCCYRRVLEQWLASNGIPSRITLETGSVPAIKESTLSCLGVCFLPEFAAQKEITEQLFCKLSCHIDSPVYTQLLIHKDKWIFPALQNLINMITSALNPS